MLEVRQIDEIVRIAAAGGEFRIDASLKQTDDLVRTAAAAATHGARIVLLGLQMRPTEDLIRIAAAGKGSVFFDDE